MVRAKSKDMVLAPVRANAAVGAKLRKRLDNLIDEMHRSVTYWIAAQYRDTPPAAIAMDDASSANSLQKAMRELTKRWLGKFDEAANELAQYFAQSAQSRSDARLRTILKKAGISIRFKMTKAQTDVLAATVHETASLIKSIPAKYLTDVEGAVMRSVQTGRDLGSLSDDLRRTFAVTKRRASFIARDQNNKATAAMNRARQIELGITQAVWVHSAGGKSPRLSHVKAGRDRAKYDVSEGWFDPHVGKHILPGELPNCRCTSRSIIKGFI